MYDPYKAENNEDCMGCSNKATMMFPDPEGAYGMCDACIAKEQTVYCKECQKEAQMVDVGSFNDCPSEGGEEWGQDINYVDLSCGHKMFDAVSTSEDN